MSRFSELTERVPLDALPLVVGRSPEADLYLSDRTVSRRHARLEQRQGRVWVVDLGSLHGTFVNGVPVRERALGAEDLIRFGRHVQYRVWGEWLEWLGAGGMAIELEDVALWAGRRVLLERICLRVPAGSFVGILGPSGAGKTMLLRLLAGIRPPSRGTIRTNYQEDIWQDIEQHRAHLAFIPQRDILYPYLTVREHLEFAARLRLGPAASGEQQQARIEQTLSMLGLHAHAGKAVGVLSGGQGKRVSVAVEWLRKPELVLLDEPTAGLDPANEARLMEQLASLARRGSTVVCATHLMENVRLFDLAAVVGAERQRGVLAYVGPPQDLLEHFGCRHFADVYERLESGQWRAPSPGEGPGQAPAGTTPPGGVPAPLSERQPARLGEDAAADSGSAGREPPLALRGLIGPAVAAGFAVQLGVVFRRSACVLWRDRWLRWMIIAQPLVLALLVSLIQFSAGTLTSLVFYSLVVACWLGMNNSIRDLVRDRRHYIRDRLGGLSPEAYLGAKWAVFALVGIGQLAAFLLAVRLLCPRIMPEHLAGQLREYNFFAWLACLGIVYLCGLGLALWVSTVVRSEEAAVVWLPILILPQILLSGLATGVANLQESDPRPFRPVIVTLRYPTRAAQAPTGAAGNSPEPERLHPVAVLADMLSMVVYTRPALLALMQPKVEGFPRAIWLADLAHLGLLLGATYLAMGVTFRRAEQHWPVLVGY